jgi:phosphoserine phosphatase RsbU/P
VTDQIVPVPADEFTLLVVEDDDHDFDAIRRHLERAERNNPVTFRCQRAKTVSTGLARLAEIVPDAVLLDLHLPDTNGIEAVELVLASGADVAIIVLTGERLRGTGLEALRRGADDYLVKDDLTSDLLFRSLLFSIERAKHRVATRAVARDRQERRAAGHIQANLLPKSTPRIPGYDIAGAYRPANKIGGDLFDIQLMPNGDLLFHVADVSGHDLGSALIMAGLRRVVRTLSPRIDDLVELATAINEAVCEDTDSFQFVTQFLVRLDTAARRFRYVAAGHVAYVFRANGEVEKLPSHVPPFGVMERMLDFEPTEVALHTGDVVVLPTDGFVEAMGPREQLWGSARLERTIETHRAEPARKIVALLMGSILDFCKPGEPADDCSVVVLKVTDPGAAVSS